MSVGNTHDPWSCPRCGKPRRNAAVTFCSLECSYLESVAFSLSKGYIPWGIDTHKSIYGNMYGGRVKK